MNALMRSHLCTGAGRPGPPTLRGLGWQNLEAMAIVRTYRSEDLGRVLDLWQRSGCLPIGPDGLSVEQAIEHLGAPGSIAVIAEEDGVLVGMALGHVAGVVGSIQRVVAPPGGRAREVVADLLDHLEARLTEQGARRLATPLRGDVELRADLEVRGYRVLDDVVYLERDAPERAPVPGALDELGGRMIDPGLWDRLKGMREAKEIIERRVILPLAEPDLASRHGVSPPRAIVLFGPPGTGKTTFAKGIASRLAWPFIEIEPAELTEQGAERQAKLLADAFARVLELPSAVVFVDEVEDLASIRHERRRAGPSVTNEFLKQIPRMREAPHHLLVCATNLVGDLDPAFLRPGRFDHVLPVGPPNEEARTAIWRRYVDEITDEEVDVPALVEASELFTPADIEFAARKAAQRAFEREHFENVRRRASTRDFLAAIEETRPTLSEESVARFREDTERFARF